VSTPRLSHAINTRNQRFDALVETLLVVRQVDALRVRRLTPLECERLMGFEDGYTAIRYRGRPARDWPRYRALGNSIAVPCLTWIGERMAMVDAIMMEDHDHGHRTVSAR
jgi:site-specific DNA-cytosine methylase